MATVEKTVELIFAGVDKASPVMAGLGGNLRGLDGVIGGISPGFGALAGSIEAVAGKLASVGNAVLGADAALAGLAVGGLTLAVKESAAFHDSFAEISTLITETGPTVDAFKDQIADYGRVSLSSFGDITNSIREAISSGVKWTDSIDFVRNAEALAVAGRADLHATTVLLVSTLNAYGKSTAEAGHFSDVFFQTVKDGQILLPELNNTLGSIVGIASAGKVPIEALGASIATLTLSGLQSEHAVVGLKGVLTEIISPSDKAKAAAKELGIEFNAEALASKGLVGILGDVAQATGGNVAKMAQLFGDVRALNAALILTSDNGLKVFRQEMLNMGNAGGVTQTAYDKMAGNIELITKNLVNNVKLTLAALGDPILAQFGSLEKAIAGLFAALGSSGSVKALQPLFDALHSAGADLQRWIEGVAKALPDAFQQVDFSPLIAAVQNLGGELGKFLDGIDLTKPEDLAKAIQFAVETLATLVDVTHGIVEAFKPIATAIQLAIAEFNDLPSADKIAFGKDFLGNAMLIEKAGVLIAGAIIAIGDKAGTMKAVWDVIAGAVQIDFNRLVLVLTGIALAIVTTFEAANKAVVYIVDTLTLGTLGPALHVSEKNIENWRKNLEKSFVDAAKGVGSGAVRIGQGFGLVGDTATTASTDVGKMAAAFSSVEVAAKKTAEELSKEAAEMKKADAIGDLFSDSTKKGTEALEEYAKGANAAATATKVIVTDTKGLTTAWGGFVQGANGVWQQMDTVAISTRKVADVMGTGAKETDAFRLKVLELDKDIQKTKMKLNVDLQIAKIKGETDEIQAMFKSIDTAISSTGTTLVGLFALVGKATQLGQSTLVAQLSASIDAEEKRRQAAFDQQKILIDKQIAMITMRNQMLSQGGALIKIDGTGLSPALQMVMWEILEKVQLEVNAQAADFLIGIA